MSQADIMPGHEKAVLQGRHRDERPPSDKPVDVVLILIDVKRTGRRGGGDTRQQEIQGRTYCRARFYLSRVHFFFTRVNRR